MEFDAIGEVDREEITSLIFGVENSQDHHVSKSFQAGRYDDGG